jgi:hypothetical protein
VRVAVIEFADDATTLVPLTDDLERARLAIGRSRLRNGRPDLAAGLAEASRIIHGGRSLPADGISNIVVVFTSEPVPGHCDATLDAANDLKALSVLIMPLCVGPECDGGCKRAVAASPRYSFSMDEVEKVAEAIFQFLIDIRGILIRRLTVAVDLTDDVALTWADPSTNVDPATGTITWTTNFVPRDGVTVTLRAQPLAAGRTPLGDVRVAWTDSSNHLGKAEADLPAVWALTPLDDSRSSTARSRGRTAVR